MNQIFYTKSNFEIEFRILLVADFENLATYLQNFSTETKSRFGPHLFDLESVKNFYSDENQNIGIIGINKLNSKIVAYSILKKGFINEDSKRYLNYNLPLHENLDCTYAPSVADDWQSQGVGDCMFIYILKILKATDYKRIVLWGGVQFTNQKAINYYQKNGFEVYGQFNNGIENLDMMKNL